jgi:hypothetical protein
MIPHWQDTEAGFLSQTPGKVRKSDTKSKEKISGSGTTVRGKWPFYDVMNFFRVLFAAQNYGYVPDTATATEVSFTDPDETEMSNSGQLEGENIIHDRKMEGGWSKNEQPVGIKRGGKIQKLTVVDRRKQYLDSLKEISKELRRPWFRISVTILI